MRVQVVAGILLVLLVGSAYPQERARKACLPTLTQAHATVVYAGGRESLGLPQETVSLCAPAPAGRFATPCDRPGPASLRRSAPVRVLKPPNQGWPK